MGERFAATMDAASSSSRGMPLQPPKTFMAQLPCHISAPSKPSMGYVMTAADLEKMRAAEKEMQEQEDLLQKQYKPVFIPVDEYLNKEINCEMINTDIKAYPWKQTPFGDAYYSPRYSDDRYTYRHVILSSSVRKEAEKLAISMPGGLLSEEVFIHYLGITMSAGWTHFMVFNKQLREIILRKPKDPEEPAAANLKERGAKRLDGEPATEDETDSDTDDDEEQRLQLQRLRELKAKVGGLSEDPAPQHHRKLTLIGAAQTRQSSSSGAVSASPADASATTEKRSESLSEVATSALASEQGQSQSQAEEGATAGPLPSKPTAVKRSAANSTLPATRARKPGAGRRVSPRQGSRRGGSSKAPLAPTRPSADTARKSRAASVTDVELQHKSSDADKPPGVSLRASGRPRAAATSAKQAAATNSSATRLGKRELAAVARSAAAAARAAAANNTTTRKRAAEGSGTTKVSEPKLSRVHR